MTFLSKDNAEVRRFVRFCVVGAMNTAVTFVTFTVLRKIGVSIYVANVLSYVAGVINSFLWNKNWVYRSHERKVAIEALLFLLFFGICWSIQALVFKAAISIFPEWLAQLIGMGTYSVINFLLNRFFTFKTER